MDKLINTTVQVDNVHPVFFSLQSSLLITEDEINCIVENLVQRFPECGVVRDSLYSFMSTGFLRLNNIDRLKIVEELRRIAKPDKKDEDDSKSKFIRICNLPTGTSKQVFKRLWITFFAKDAIERLTHDVREECGVTINVPASVQAEPFRFTKYFLCEEPTYSSADIHFIYDIIYFELLESIADGMLCAGASSQAARGLWRLMTRNVPREAATAPHFRELFGGPDSLPERLGRFVMAEARFLECLSDDAKDFTDTASLAARFASIYDAVEPASSDELHIALGAVPGPGANGPDTTLEEAMEMLRGWVPGPTKKGWRDPVPDRVWDMLAFPVRRRAVSCPSFMKVLDRVIRNDDFTILKLKYGFVCRMEDRRPKNTGELRDIIRECMDTAKRYYSRFILTEGNDDDYNSLIECTWRLRILENVMDTSLHGAFWNMYFRVIDGMEEAKKINENCLLIIYYLFNVAVRNYKDQKIKKKNYTLPSLSFRLSWLWGLYDSEKSLEIIFDVTNGIINTIRDTLLSGNFEDIPRSVEKIGWQISEALKEYRSRNVSYFFELKEGPHPSYNNTNIFSFITGIDALKNGIPLNCVLKLTPLKVKRLNPGPDKENASLDKWQSNILIATKKSQTDPFRPLIYDDTVFKKLEGTVRESLPNADELMKLDVEILVFDDPLKVTTWKGITKKQRGNILIHCTSRGSSSGARMKILSHREAFFNPYAVFENINEENYYTLTIGAQNNLSKLYLFPYMAFNETRSTRRALKDETENMTRPGDDAIDHVIDIELNDDFESREYKGPDESLEENQAGRDYIYIKKIIDELCETHAPDADDRLKNFLLQIIYYYHEKFRKDARGWDLKNTTAWNDIYKDIENYHHKKEDRYEKKQKNKGTAKKKSAKMSYTRKDHNSVKNLALKIWKNDRITMIDLFEKMQDLVLYDKE